ncbi:MAG: aminodeoxychorismate/anthranilate synthase component II [Calditrichaeota bacterium]|nr:MAG: aminodeoxychorismate/anthranilate synthase component II [Calditrichota bacterium]
MILLVDNYDSFTHNIVHILSGAGYGCDVVQNDALHPEDVEGYRAMIFSPGPGRPEEAGMLPELAKRYLSRMPILGVCLGHQALALATGGRLFRLPDVWHGKTSLIRHAGQGIFKDIASPMRVMRYHSLAVEADHLPKAWQVTAVSPDGVVMAMEHRDYPVYGVQFHPESVCTAQGARLLLNFARQALAA